MNAEDRGIRLLRNGLLLLIACVVALLSLLLGVR